MHLPSIEKAVFLYYAKPELENIDIKELFGASDSSVRRIKAPVLKAMAEQGIKSWAPYTINTRVAYEVWGINIPEYEERLKKLTQINMLKH